MLDKDNKVKLMALAVQRVNARGKGDWRRVYGDMVSEVERGQHVGRDLCRCGGVRTYSARTVQEGRGEPRKD